MSENLIEQEVESTLIKRVIYDVDDELLTIVFSNKYYIKQETFMKVPPDYFHTLITAKSCGSFYLNYIKKTFKTKNMAEEVKKKKLPTKNRASSKKRFIKMRINVQAINKDWMTPGEKGTYLDITLQMLPDGKIDKYGNLGMITQDVPTAIYKATKDDADKPQGAILGNGQEIDWDALNNGGANKANPGEGKSFAEMNADDIPPVMDDLPF